LPCLRKWHWRGNNALVTPTCQRKTDHNDLRFFETATSDRSFNIRVFDSRTSAIEWYLTDHQLPVKTKTVGNHLDTMEGTTMSQIQYVLSFLHDTTWNDIPSAVQQQANFVLLDLVGSLCGGRRTRLSQIIRRHALSAFGGEQASLLLDGRRCSAPGAALVNGMTIDSLDIHDSHRESLGHAGVHIFPTVLAVAQQKHAAGRPLISGKEFLASLVVGFDLAIRAGVMLHATACDYHTSGAWGAVSSAALFSRLHGLSSEETRHAIGIAEYHGPRSQMMRCIDHPTMVKDGSGWGAMAGISAGMLAADGFTGAPALTVESPEVAHGWQELGDRWLIMEQGYKVHAVCWWAQPAIEATLATVRQHQLSVPDIARIEVKTFKNATHLNHPRPATTEEAQYSLPYPVAAALWNWHQSGDDADWNGVGPRQLIEKHLNNEHIFNLAERVVLTEAPHLTEQFPDRFLASATITMQNGDIFNSDETTFRGELDNPLTEPEFRAKYRWLANDTLSPKRVTALEDVIFNLNTLPDIKPLLDLLVLPPDRPDND
jgi:2-methylcitrate dehydratase PrpD